MLVTTTSADPSAQLFALGTKPRAEPPPVAADPPDTTSEPTDSVSLSRPAQLVLAGEAPGRVAPEQITVFDSVGFALEDFSALRLLRDFAAELGLGRSIDLVPEMADPKNLFGALYLPAARGASPRVAVAA